MVFFFNQYTISGLLERSRMYLLRTFLALWKSQAFR